MAWEVIAMSMDEQNLQENKEKRKKKRQQEQVQAFAVLAGAVVALVLVLVIIYSGVNAVIKATSNDKEVEKESVEVEETIENEKAEEAESDNETEEELSSDSESSNNGEENQVAEAVSENAVTEAEETVSVEEMTDEQKDAILESYVKNIIDTMSIEEKVAGMFLVTPYNLTGVTDVKQAGSSLNEAMNTYQVGGMLFDTENIVDKEQLSQMIYNTSSFSKYELLIAVSDEGGEESPLAALRENIIPGQAQIAMEGGGTGAYSAGIHKSSDFRSIGINLNLAPVADVTLNSNSVIAERSYGNSVSNVLSLVKSEVKGMADQGVECCLKYFPSHGDVSGDTETAKVTSQRTKEDLMSTEYEIFEEMIEEGIPMIMVSHVSMPKVNGDNKPSSLSSVMVTDILRGELGFEGVIITDYMDKMAITKYFKHADASVMAVQAGVDMIAVPSDFKKSYDGLLKAVKSGEITEERIDESLVRILKMKYKTIVDYEVSQ